MSAECNDACEVLLAIWLMVASTNARLCMLTPSFCEFPTPHRREVVSSARASGRRTRAGLHPAAGSV